VSEGGNNVQRRSDLFKPAPEKDDQVDTRAAAERTGAAASGATLGSGHLALEGGEGSLHEKKSSQYAFATPGFNHGSSTYRTIRGWQPVRWEMKFCLLSHHSIQKK